MSQSETHANKAEEEEKSSSHNASNKNIDNVEASLILKEFFDAIKSQNTPLVYDFIKKYQQSIDIINRIDPSNHQNALYYAATIPNQDKALEISKILIENGGKINAKDSLKQSPLFYVSREGNIPLFDYYIKKGASLLETDVYEQSPVYYVARENNLPLAKKMHSLGADFNKLDYLNQSCLFYAAREGQADMVQWLLDIGLDVNHCDNKRNTALTWAKKCQKGDVVDILLARGAINTKDGKLTQKDLARIKKGESTVQPKIVEPEKPPEVIVEIKKEEPPAPKPKESVGKSNLIKRKKEKDANKIMYRVVLTDGLGQAKDLTMGDLTQFEETYPDFVRYLKNPESIPLNDDTWEGTARKILSTLWKAKGGYFFHRPVDPIEYHIQDYFDIIKKPMDYGTIKERLNSHHYKAIKEFLDDVNLVFNNCIKYNGATSEVGQIGVNSQRQFKNLCETLNVNQYLNNKMEEEDASGENGHQHNGIHAGEMQEKQVYTFISLKNDQQQDIIKFIIFKGENTLQWID